MSKKRPLLIHTYLSYGTDKQLHVNGRALEDKQILFGSNQSIFKTFANIYKQFESNEIPNTTIQLTVSNGATYDTITDMEGYYTFGQQTSGLEQLTNKDGWLAYTSSYMQPPENQTVQNENLFSGAMLIPNKKAKFGIISDIDDTILHTGVSSRFKWRLLINTLFKNFDERIPLEGAADFYQKLLQPTHEGTPINPIFYVSNSPWNLYDYLVRFLQKNKFPKGPVLLRDIWTPFDKTERPKTPHKYNEINRILATYPNLNFILIGDSGEKDGIYYSEIAKKHPNRILAIYLRSVKNKRRQQKAQQLIQNFDLVPMLLIDNSDEIEAHATSIGIL